MHRLNFLLLLFLCTTAAAQESQLTLPQAIEKALASNPELIATTRDVGIAEAGVEQAQLLPNPELQALSEGIGDDKRTTTIQLNQVIELGGKRSSRINAAERDQAAALADLATRRAELRANVMGAYFEVLNTQERIELAEASYQLATQVSQAAKRRVMAGRISPIEETRTKVAELTIKTEWNQAKAEYEVAKTRLAALLGDKMPKFDRVDQSTSTNPNYDWPTLESQLSKAPQLIRAQLEIDRQHAQTDVERSRRIGDVTLSIGKKREQDSGLNQTIVGFSIPIPLFDRNQGNVLGALRKTDKARDEFNATETRLRAELSQAYQRYAATKFELATLHNDILPSAEEALDATITGFEFGKFNMLDVLEAQKTLFQTKLQYLQVQSESYKSMTDIERIVGNQL